MKTGILEGNAITTYWNDNVAVIIEFYR